MVATSPERAGKSRTRSALIDCDLHNELHGDIEAILPYMSSRWRKHVESFGARSAAGGYYPRFLDHREDARPPTGRRAGSDARFTASDYLDRFNVAYGILIPLSGTTGQLNLELSAEMARAVNEWQIAEWLDVDTRYRATMAIPVEAPDLAVQEIRNRARDRRFVQVQFPGRPHEPMGRRKYWPIYEACAEYDLKVMSHAFGSYGQPTTGTGWPSFYLEEHIGPAQAIQANIMSMVVEGVFERFPTLKVVSVENGFGWLPWLTWRLDATWHLLKDEVPHLKHAPSEYVRQNVYVTTQPMEESHKPRYFLEMIEQFGDLVNHLLFASDYPHWDADAPDDSIPVQLPDDLLRKIYFDNGAKLYGLT